MRSIAVLTDFGLADHYAGVVHAVLEREAPGVPRFDLGHEIPPGDIWAACFQLRCAWPHLPGDCVVTVVVDPGVGTARRAVAAAIGERHLVAPDNGIVAATGSASAAVALDWRVMGLAEPSATFHGRDLFAPAAARLARGAQLADLGPAVEVGTLVPCMVPEPTRTRAGIEGTIVHVDRFGNLITNLRAGDWADVAGARFDGRSLRRVRTYGDARAEEVVVLEGSAGYLELAINCGSAAEATGLERGDTVVFDRGRDG